MERSTKKIAMFLLLHSLMAVSACHHKEHDKNDLVKAVSPASAALEKYNNATENRVLTDKVYEGDTVAYHELKSRYFNSTHKKEFLYLAMFMGTVYNLPEANSDTYFILKSDSITDKNFKINKLANYFLIKAYEQKRESIKAVRERLGNQFRDVPKSEDYLCKVAQNN